MENLPTAEKICVICGVSFEVPLRTVESGSYSFRKDELEEFVKCGHISSITVQCGVEEMHGVTHRLYTKGSETNYLIIPEYKSTDYNEWFPPLLLSLLIAFVVAFIFW